MANWLVDFEKTLAGEPISTLQPMEQRPVRQQGSWAEDFDAILEQQVQPQQELPQQLPAEHPEGKIGFWENIARGGWGGFFDKASLGVKPLIEASLLFEATQRFQSNAYGKDSFGREKRARDEERIFSYLEEQAEVAERGLTIPAKVGGIVGEMLPFMAEFLLTGGASAIGKKAISKGVLKLITRATGKAAAGVVGRSTAQLAGWVTAAGIRTALTPHRSLKDFIDRRMPDIQISPEGQLIFQEAEESPFRSAYKAIGNQFIEMASEESGAFLGQLAGKITSKVLPKGAVTAMNKLKNAWIGAGAGRTAQEFAKKMSTKVGFNGVLEEFGEERLGALMRVVAGIDDGEGTTFEKIGRALYPGNEQAFVELIAFSVPGVARGVAAQAFERKTAYSRKEFKELTGREKSSLAERTEAFEADQAAVAEVPPVETQERLIDDQGNKSNIRNRLKDQGIDQTLFTKTITQMAEQGKTPNQIARALDGLFPGWREIQGFAKDALWKYVIEHQDGTDTRSLTEILEKKPVAAEAPEAEITAPAVAQEPDIAPERPRQFREEDLAAKLAEQEAAAKVLEPDQIEKGAAVTEPKTPAGIVSEPAEGVITEEGAEALKQPEPAKAEKPVAAKKKPAEPDLTKINPKSKTAVDNAILNRDAEVLKRWLHKGNKELRKYFRKITGVKLPNTERDTKTAIDDFVRTPLTLDEKGKLEDFFKTEAARIETARIEAEKTVAAKVEAEKPEVKEIERAEEEAIIEPTPSPAVEPAEAGEAISRPAPTGKLDPTNPTEAIEITKLHANFVAGKEVSVGGIFSTKWDAAKKDFVVDSVEYTSEQIDAAYRLVQKPIESPMPDVSLFAMPGKEKQLAAIALKMSKQKPPKKKVVRLAKPKPLPRAVKKQEDHVKAVFVATVKEESEGYALTGVSVEGENLVATDGRRLFIAKGKWGKDGLYLDRTSLKDGKMGKADKKGKFVKWQDIVPETPRRDAAIVVTDLATLWRHVHQAGLLASEDSKGVTILVNKDGTLGFASATPETGHVEVNVWPGARILAGMNPQFLIDAIAFHAKRGDTSIEFYFQEADRPILTRSLDGKTSTVTMPVTMGEPSAELKETISEGFGAKNTTFKKADFAKKVAEEKAGEPLKGKGRRKGAAIVVTAADLKRAAWFAGFYFEGGLREFQAWSAKLIEIMGSPIRPHLEKLWAQAKKDVEVFEAEKVSPEAPKVSEKAEKVSKPKPAPSGKKTKGERNVIKAFAKEVESLTDKEEDITLHTIPNKDQMEVAERLLADNPAEAEEIVFGRTSTTEVLVNALRGLFIQKLVAEGKGDEASEVFGIMQRDATRFGRESSVMQEFLRDTYSLISVASKVESIRKSREAKKIRKRGGGTKKDSDSKVVEKEVNRRVNRLQGLTKERRMDLAKTMEFLRKKKCK